MISVHLHATPTDLTQTSKMQQKTASARFGSGVQTVLGFLTFPLAARELAITLVNSISLRTLRVVCSKRHHK